MIDNSELRLRICEIIAASGEGHIPSSFSVVDIIEHLYARVLCVDPSSPDNPDRDFFVLSKGHSAAALFVVLQKHGFISDTDLDNYSQPGGILGGHPDRTLVPGVEASTGSLGHGLPYAVGIALHLRNMELPNRVFVLIGDGESHEGTVWEAANVAAGLALSNLTVIVDDNESGKQLISHDSWEDKWAAFGWTAVTANGHSNESLQKAFATEHPGAPLAIIAKTTKGKGVEFLEGHGVWHHRIPSEEEMQQIRHRLEKA